MPKKQMKAKIEKKPMNKKELMQLLGMSNYKTLNKFLKSLGIEKPQERRIFTVSELMPIFKDWC
jgi:hypothetical protein